MHNLDVLIGIVIAAFILQVSFLANANDLDEKPNQARQFNSIEAYLSRRNSNNNNSDNDQQSPQDQPDSKLVQGRNLQYSAPYSNIQNSYANNRAPVQYNSPPQQYSIPALPAYTNRPIFSWSRKDGFRKPTYSGLNNPAPSYSYPQYLSPLIPVAVQFKPTTPGYYNGKPNPYEVFELEKPRVELHKVKVNKRPSYKTVITFDKAKKLVNKKTTKKPTTTEDPPVISQTENASDSNQTSPENEKQKPSDPLDKVKGLLKLKPDQDEADESQPSKPTNETSSEDPKEATILPKLVSPSESPIKDLISSKLDEPALEKATTTIGSLIDPKAKNKLPILDPRKNANSKEPESSDDPKEQSQSSSPPKSNNEEDPRVTTILPTISPISDFVDRMKPNSNEEDPKGTEQQEPILEDNQSGDPRDATVLPDIATSLNPLNKLPVDPKEVISRPIEAMRPTNIPSISSDPETNLRPSVDENAEESPQQSDNEPTKSETGPNTGNFRKEFPANFPPFEDNIDPISIDIKPNLKGRLPSPVTDAVADKLPKVDSEQSSGDEESPLEKLEKIAPTIGLKQSANSDPSEDSNDPRVEGGLQVDGEAQSPSKLGGPGLEEVDPAATGSQEESESRAQSPSKSTKPNGSVLIPDPTELLNREREVPENEEDFNFDSNVDDDDEGAEGGEGELEEEEEQKGEGETNEGDLISELGRLGKQSTGRGSKALGPEAASRITKGVKGAESKLKLPNRNGDKFFGV